MKPLRIVLVLLEAPVPFGNAAARWYYVLLRGLVARGHQVTAFAACSKPEELALACDLFPPPQYDLRCYAFPQRQGWRAKLQTLRRPFSYMFSPALHHDLKAELARGFDLLHLEQLWSGWLGLDHADRALLSIHYLFRIDLSLVKPSSWRSRLERRLMLRGERLLLSRFKHIRSCSSRLVPEIAAINPAAQITTVPFGLDLEQYRYIPDEERTAAQVVSVIGSMGWYPTHSAAVRLLTRLWPAIKKQVPEARVQIVGWNACQALADYMGMPDVAIEENVPDIKPYFRRTGVLLYAPGRGSGMKIKVQEALAFGVPVVTTSEGVEGLPAEDGVHVGLAEDDAGLIARAVGLLQDRAAQNRQRLAGRAMLEAYCAPKPTLDALEAVYQRMLASGAE